MEKTKIRDIFINRSFYFGLVAAIFLKAERSESISVAKVLSST